MNINNLFKRLMTTTTQQDIKKFDKLIYRYLDVNSKTINQEFKRKLNEMRQQSCECHKCDQVRAIVNPKVIGIIEKVD